MVVFRNVLAGYIASTETVKVQKSLILHHQLRADHAHRESFQLRRLSYKTYNSFCKRYTRPNPRVTIKILTKATSRKYEILHLIVRKPQTLEFRVTP